MEQKLTHPLIRLLFILAFLFASLPVMANPVSAQATVAAPTFSVVHGFFNAPFQLTLSSATAGASIRYTTDFTTPTPVTGTVYSGPITISGTSVIRAIAYTSATAKSPFVTQTYIFLAQVKTQPQDPTPAMLAQGWPTVFAPNDSRNDFAGPFPADYGMDPDIVNHPNYVNQIDPALLSLPAVSIVTDQPNLWDPNIGVYYNPNEKDGDPDSRLDPLNNKWERPISIEWISPAGGPGFTENGGVRIHGQASRRPKNTPKKTLRVYFKAAYGVSKLDFALFDHNDPVAKFDRIVLRNGGNRSWPYWDRDQRREADYVNDEWSRRTWLQMGHLTSHGTYAHLYINGLYWGLVNVAERLDEKMIGSYIGAKDSEIDYIVTDEDFNDIPVASNGTLDAFNALVAALSGTASLSDATYQQVAQMMDMEDFADYLLHTHYIGKTDWPNHNWNAYRKRVGPDTKFRWMTWDNDSGLNKVDQPWDSPNAPLDTPQSPSWMFLRLITNNEFKQLFSDRIYKHVVSPDGVLTPANCSAVYSQLTTIIDQAIIGESARWGDYSRDVYHRPLTDAPKAWPAYLYSRDLPASDPLNFWSPWSGDQSLLNDEWKRNWVQVRDAKLANYCPNRGNNLVGQYVGDGLYQTTLLAPAYSQRGGAVIANYTLAISNPNGGAAGDIYFTSDGSDPRSFAGAIGASAQLGNDSANVTISQVTRLRARIKNGAAWSPLMDYLFYPPQPFSNLVINEVHYNPLPPAGQDGDNYEFIELHNAGATPLRLDNVSFSRGISYRFPYSTTLATGQFIVLASDAARFKTRYGFDAFAAYRGNLSNAGEAVELRDAVGNAIDFVSYLPTAPWPTTPAGTGPALQLNNPTLDNSLAVNWHASPANNGNPGQANASGAGNMPPTVSVTVPATGTIILASTLVTISADASDSDGTITQVLFQANGNTLCTDSSVPYECAWTPTVGGNVTLTAIASDNHNVSTTSTAVIVTINAPNQPPTVAISAPANGASLTQGNVVNLSATANDVDGTVTQVLFQANGSPLFTDASAPFEYAWTPATTGIVTLTAVATDNATASTTSTPVVVTVNAPGTGAFLEQGGTVVMEAENFHAKTARSAHDWQAQTTPAGFSGAAAMTALPNNNTNIQTNVATTSPEMIYQVNFGATGTYNFWVRAVGPAGSDDSIHFGADGVVRGSPSVTGASWFWKKGGTITIASAGLHTIHLWMREDGASVDKLLLTMAATTPTGTGPAESPRAGGSSNIPPTVAISSPANGASSVAGSTVTIIANASDADGTVTQVVFQANGSLLCTDTTAPYECVWTPSTPGNVSLTAVATDNGSASTTSAPVNVTITAPGNVPPSVSITAPANGANSPVGTLINITANASDSDGTVTQVLFKANGNTLCTDTSAPYECGWTPTSAGSYSLTAVATDNGGATTTTSAPINVTVTGNGGNGAFLEQGGTVVMEAENFHAKTARSAHDWQAQTTPTGFSGAAAMTSLPNNGANIQTNIETSSPEMVYQINVATLGTYNLWVRAVGPTGSDDSIHVGFDGMVRASPAVSGASWFWKKAGTVAISTAGLHTVHVWMREDGASVDKLLLTTAATTPSGIGPAESGRDGNSFGMTLASDLFSVEAVDAQAEVNLQLSADATTLLAGQPINLVAQVVGGEANAWHIAFLVNDVVIDGCDAEATTATCTWTPTAGNYQLQVVAQGDEMTLTSTTVDVTIDVTIETGQQAPKVYLPLILQ